MRRFGLSLNVIGLLIATCVAHAAPPATLPTTRTVAGFDIHCNRKDDSVAVTIVADRTTFDIKSLSGIGSTMVERNEHAWPEHLLLRVHLGGLEAISITVGDLKLSASVASHGDNVSTLTLKKDGKDALPITKDSPYFIEIHVQDSKGKAVNGLPDKGGYFEMAVPQALLDEKASKLTIEWVDFYR